MIDDIPQCTNLDGILICYLSNWDQTLDVYEILIPDTLDEKYFIKLPRLGIVRILV